MKANVRLPIAIAAMTIPLISSSTASALSTIAWGGRAQGTPSCFTESYGTVTNANCDSAYWEIPLEVDSAGTWKVTINVTPTSDASTVDCRTYGLSADTTSVVNVSELFKPTTASVAQNLDPMLVTVPSGGSLYVACTVKRGAKLNTVNWNADPLTGTPLAVTFQAQQETNWCWAATGQMIFSYLGTPVAQCDEANHEFHQTDCCYNGGSAGCNQTGHEEWAFWGFNATFNGNPRTFPQLQTEFAANRPVQFTWDWNTGGSHDQVAIGAETDGSGVQYVTIIDPGLGDATVTYNDWKNLDGPGGHTFGGNYYSISHM